MYTECGVGKDLEMVFLLKKLIFMGMYALLLSTLLSIINKQTLITVSPWC